VGNSTRPALLSGSPAFVDTIPIAKPTLPAGNELAEALEKLFVSGMITCSSSVERFETEAAEYLGLKYVVAVSSCTSGLMLVLKALGLKGEMILPSFTFSATGHALLWNSIHPKFADISEKMLNINVVEIEQAITDKTVAILAVHIFGNPCDVSSLEILATKYGLKLVFDAAHALGSIYKGRKIGTFGDAEVFSLSPTKLVVAGEGGLVATNDRTLARMVKIGRNYGDPGNYDCEFAGLSARMPEINAVLGLWSLKRLEAQVEKRNLISDAYRSLLRGIPGLSFQEIPTDRRSTYKDFAVIVDPLGFGMTRDELAIALDAENIMTRKYFDPPLHKQRAYLQDCTKYDGRLSITEKISRSILCLPIFSHIEADVVERISETIFNIRQDNEEIVEAIRQRKAG